MRWRGAAPCGVGDEGAHGPAGDAQAALALEARHHARQVPPQQRLHRQGPRQTPSYSISPIKKKSRPRHGSFPFPMRAPEYRAPEHSARNPTRHSLAAVAIARDTPICVSCAPRSAEGGAFPGSRRAGDGNNKMPQYRTAWTPPTSSAVWFSRECVYSHGVRAVPRSMAANMAF